MTADRWMKRLMVLGGVSALLIAPAASRAQDVISVGSVACRPGGRAVVPIHLRLGSSAAEAQAVALKVRFNPARAVVAARLRRAGSLAGLRPIFEATPQTAGSASYIATFDERTGAVPFRTGAAGGEPLVAQLELWLARDLSDGDVVGLELAPEACALGNRAGTQVHTVHAGTLALVGGSVSVVVPPPHEFPPR